VGVKDRAGDGMKRERLRRTLALAAIETLRDKNKTTANIKRYVVPILTLYNIRATTEITPCDIEIALRIVYEAQSQKPIHFWNRRDRPSTYERKEFLRTMDISDIG
jgi:hypothetical protein